MIIIMTILNNFGQITQLTLVGMKSTQKTLRRQTKQRTKTRKAKKAPVELCTCSPDVGDCPKCNKKCYIGAA